MKDLKNKIPKSNSWIFLLLICIITCFMSIGFAQINILLGINGTAITVLQDDIFITDVNYLRSVNADLNNSQILDMYQTNLSTNITLSKTDPNSSITYAIEIYNPTSFDYKFDDALYMLGINTYDNENIAFKLEGLSKGDIIGSKQAITFNITFYYKNNVVSSNNQLKSLINFKFNKNVVLATVGTLNNKLANGIFDSSIYKSSVERIYFVDHENVPAGAIVWDASVEGNYAVTGWAVDDNQNGIYEVYFGANDGRIALPTSCNSLFYWYTSLISIDFNNIDTSQVTDMSYMFAYSYSLTELNLSNFDTSNVTTMAYMFNSVSKITTFDLSSFDTSKTTSMSYMFSGCSPQLVKLSKATFTHLSPGRPVIPNISSPLIVVVKDSTEKEWLLENTYYGSQTQLLTIEEYNNL